MTMKPSDALPLFFRYYKYYLHTKEVKIWPLLPLNLGKGKVIMNVDCIKYGRCTLIETLC